MVVWFEFLPFLREKGDLTVQPNETGTEKRRRPRTRNGTGAHSEFRDGNRECAPAPFLARGGLSDVRPTI